MRLCLTYDDDVQIILDGNDDDTKIMSSGAFCPIIIIIIIIIRVKVPEEDKIYDVEYPKSSMVYWTKS